jgi:cell wall integrity and stress response component
LTHGPPSLTAISHTGGGFTDAGKTFYSVFNVGIKIAVPYMAASSSTTTSSAVTDDNAPAATSASNQPASSSSSSSPADDGDKSDDGPSIGGIVGGVVAGVAVVGILGAIAFFIWRRRRNQAIEDEHRRNATVNSFISGAKPTSSSGVSMTDSRMDPGMAHQRRLSDGSIADNQDYSRKILRVSRPPLATPRPSFITNTPSRSQTRRRRLFCHDERFSYLATYHTTYIAASRHTKQPPTRSFQAFSAF